MAQGRLRTMPRYILIAETGPDHEKTFEMACVLGQEEMARATGKSKKEAEQRAAQLALSKLEREAKA